MPLLWFRFAQRAPLVALLACASLCAAERVDKNNAAFDVAPRAIDTVEPLYPLALERFGITGDVTLEVVVGVDGRVKSAMIVESDNPGFEESALEAVLEWRFKPALKFGKPLQATTRVPIYFEMEDLTRRTAFQVGGRFDPKKLPAGMKFDTPPELKSVALPVYPYALRRDKVTGKVRVAIAIDATGAVTEVKIMEATHPEFGLALQAAVEGFRFHPAKLERRAVPSAIAFEQTFSDLQPPDSPGDGILSLEKRNPDNIASAAQLDQPLKLRSQRPPRFPLGLPEGVTSGEALVECVIDTKGRVRVPRIKSATHDAFGYAAVQAASTWWFDPPRVTGKPTAVRVLIPFSFGGQPAAAGAKPAP